MDRERLTFTMFFNAGIDRITGMCDVEGSDVFEYDDDGTPHYIGSINWVLPEDISMMDDDELENLLAENGIFPCLA